MFNEYVKNYNEYKNYLDFYEINLKAAKNVYEYTLKNEGNNEFKVKRDYEMYMICKRSYESWLAKEIFFQKNTY